MTHTLRTFDEQHALYAKGRELPGARVTNAPAGMSWHNYGRAFDICFTVGVPYPPDDALWIRVGEIGEGLGLEWGGRWKSFPDKPHFQFRDDMTIADALALHDAEMKA